MLGRFYTFGLGARAEAVVAELADARARLREGKASPEEETAAGQSFLNCVETAANELGVSAADRGYRRSFTANYRALFPDAARRYRMDLLEASADHSVAIWVNGDKFELSGEAVGHAEQLQLDWASLQELLDRWPAPAVQLAHALCQDVASVLEKLDAAWARFEQSYVSELIAIEGRARKLLETAVQQERRVRHSHQQKRQEAQRELAATVAKINAVANCRRKGRDDLDPDILFRAQDVLRDAKHASGPGKQAARLLAAEVVDSFEAVSKYFREVGRCMERVDPHLCNNAGLVSRLVDWEESWEMGARFVRDPAVLGGVCDLVSELTEVASLVPGFSAMISSCEAELFMVLPRLVCLGFAARPAAPRAALLRELLRHRWVEQEGCLQMGPELRSLAQDYHATARALCAAPGGCSGGEGCRECASAREALVARAVAGPGDPAGGPAGEGHAAAVEVLMRTVEGWSLELQRHCPEDWNQCSAVLVRCLAEQEQER